MIINEKECLEEMKKDNEWFSIKECNTNIIFEKENLTMTHTNDFIK